MNSLLLLIVVVAILSGAGFLVTDWFWRSVLNVFEKIGISFAFGLVLNYFLTLLATLAGFKVTLVSSLIPLMLVVGGVLFLNFKNRAIRPTKELASKGWKERAVNVGLFIFLVVFFLSLGYKTLVSGFNAWDEFSFWGKATKAVNFTQDFFMMDALSAEGDSNPTLVPVSANLLASASPGFFAENYAKMLSPLSLLFFVIFLYGYMLRLDIKPLDRALFTILFLLSSQKMIQLSTILYADIFFLYIYAMGTACLLRVVAEKNNYKLMGLAVTILAFLPLLKRGGSISALITIFSVYIFTINIKKSWRQLTPLVLSAVAIVLVQLFSTYLGKLGGDVFSPYPPEPFQYTRQAIIMLPDLIIVMFRKIFSLDYHTIIFPLSLAVMSLAFWVNKNKAYLTVFLIGILNAGYFFAGALVLFSLEELMVLASFERYIVQFLPIFFIGTILAYKELATAYTTRPDRSTQNRGN